MSFLLLTMQSYCDFLPIPRNFPNSSLTCSDNRPHRRHIRQMPSETVAHKSAHKGQSCCDMALLNFLATQQSINGFFSAFAARKFGSFGKSLYLCRRNQ